jgi:hypothetical protein
MRSRRRRVLPLACMGAVSAACAATRPASVAPRGFDDPPGAPTNVAAIQADASADAHGRTAPATDLESETERLARAAQNPVAAMYSLPFQYNASFRVGPRDQIQHLLNVQPVIPISLNENWNLISRSILPIMGQPDPAEGDHENGIGDLQETLFLSPAQPSKLIWGVGPVVVAPTASDDLLGSGKWSAGPSAVALTMDGPWVVGALVQNVWDFDGLRSRRSVNQFLLQPIVNYNMAGGWYLVSSPIITADWQTELGRDVWTVPVGGGVGRIMKICDQAVNVSLQAYYDVAHPTDGPGWSLRLQFTLLFPRDSPKKDAK